MDHKKESKCQHDYEPIYGDKKNKNKNKFLKKRSQKNYYLCNYNGCNRIFYGLGPLNNHKKIHFKSFECKICLKSFGAKKDLLIHERIHNDQRPEKCKICFKSFKDPAALRKHTKYIHSDGVELRPFVCKICRKKFTRKHSLQKHYKTHKVKVK